jgi:hypothetical protein
LAINKNLTLFLVLALFILQKLHYYLPEMKKPNRPAKIPKPVKSVKNGTKAVDIPHINIQKAYKAFRFIHDWSLSHPRGQRAKIINRDNNQFSAGRDRLFTRIAVSRIFFIFQTKISVL